MLNYRTFTADTSRPRRLVLIRLPRKFTFKQAQTCTLELHSLYCLSQRQFSRQGNVSLHRHHLSCFFLLWADLSDMTRKSHKCTAGERTEFESTNSLTQRIAAIMYSTSFIVIYVRSPGQFRGVPQEIHFIK